MKLLPFQRPDWRLKGAQPAINPACPAPRVPGSGTKAQTFVRKPFLALLSGGDHGDDLPPAGNQIMQKPRRCIGKRPDFRFCRQGETSDDQGIDRAALGALAEGFSKAANVRRIDGGGRQTVCRKARGGDGLESSRPSPPRPVARAALCVR
jgi:hypothetical protein